MSLFITIKVVIGQKKNYIILRVLDDKLLDIYFHFSMEDNKNTVLD